MATQGGTSGAPDRPNDAKAIDSILRSMGARADSRTVYMLLEFAYRYAVEILQDSHEFAVHAGRSEVKEADVKLAVDARATHSFTSPPTREFLAEIAEKRNALPLPTVGERYGPRLPPQNFLLTHPNFRIVPKKIIRKRKNPAPHHPQSASPPEYGSPAPSESDSDLDSDEEELGEEDDEGMDEDEDDERMPEVEGAVTVSIPVPQGQGPGTIQGMHGQTGMEVSAGMGQTTSGAGGQDMGLDDEDYD